jgi:hypothetical protein
MIRPAVVAVGVMLQLGCAWWPDASIRFKDCAEEATAKHARDGAAAQASCDLQVPGSYLVVLHPAGALREEELAAAGLPSALLPELRGLRLGENPAIYVIATDPGVSGVGTERTIRSNWTTSQMHFVQIDKVMVLARTTPPVTIDVAGPAERPVIEGLR